MSYNLIFTESYKRRVKKFLRKHPNLKDRYYKTVDILEINPFHPSLRLHKLEGNLSHLHSISINMNYRITIELLIDDNNIIPIMIGTHSDVYK